MEWRDPPPSLTGHVVICNCNEKVGRVVEELHQARRDGAGARGLDVVLVVQDAGLWEHNPAWHPRTLPADDAPMDDADDTSTTGGRFFTLCGCPTQREVLLRAGIDRARAAVILADPAQGNLADARSTLVAVAVEQYSPQVHTVMELLASVNRAHLEATEVNEVICLGEISEKLVAQSCITPGIKNMFARLLTTSHGTEHLFSVPLPRAFDGQTFRQLARRAIETRAPLVLCGFVREPDDEGAGSLVLNPAAGRDPGKDTPLGRGDELVLLARDTPDLSVLAGGS